jgi:hypothetical protein
MSKETRHFGVDLVEIIMKVAASPLYTSKTHLTPPQHLLYLPHSFFRRLPMFRILAVLTLLLPLVATGCSSWQANSSSQAVDINPGAFGTGQSVFTPASGGDWRR